jgi:hypothetical protein
MLHYGSIYAAATTEDQWKYSFCIVHRTEYVAGIISTVITLKYTYTKGRMK